MKLTNILLGLAILCASVFAQANVKSSTINALNYMKSIYGDVYAPAPWKARFDNWEISKEYQHALDQIEEAGDTLDTITARKILMGFVYSMRDYHVSIRFYSTEAARLPFLVRSAEGRFFIVHIDSKKLDSKLYPFAVGDEVIKFNGKPVSEVVDSLKIYEHNVTETDQALAELGLTLRRASRGFDVPKGTVEVTVKKKGSDKLITRQMIWDYTPEKVPTFEEQSLLGLDSKKEITSKSVIPSPMMMAEEDLDLLNPHGLGDKKGYLPNLGEPIWEATKDELYRAYIYKSESGEMIGVVRIPGYIVKDYDASIANFKQIIKKMQKVTDKLVIDQLNNPGGSVFYLYSLASHLSDQPLQAPRHTMAITPAGVDSCVKTLKAMKSIDTDAKAKQSLGKSVSGYPMTLQFVKFYQSYCKVIINDWKAGQTMTRPFWIAGVDKINPSDVQYTKPILILVNELDFSGGDFFPTIMQDNKRATIMGVRTAGAGGYVLGYKFPNFIGIESFRVTESLAFRVDQNPIENLGVTPDVEYRLKVKDRQNNYSEYVKAIKENIKSLK